MRARTPRWRLRIPSCTCCLRFAPEPKRGDILVRSAGTAVLVDAKTALYLKGTELDYSDKMIGGGFKFANPNAKASCSCGESFSV